MTVILFGEVCALFRQRLANVLHGPGMSFTAQAGNYAIMVIMSEPFVFLGNIPTPTPEEKAEVDRLIERAKAEGNPWANMIGIFPDDEITRIWIEEMKAARQRDEENPHYYGGLG